MSRKTIDFESLDAMVAAGVELPLHVRRIRSRCTECGDCWLWDGHMDANNIPKINVNGTPRSARRVIYEHFHGPVRPKFEIKAKCGIRNCVSPNCSAEYSRSASMKITASNRVTTAAHINAARNRGKLDVEKAAEIRVSQVPNRKLAALYGVDSKVIWLIKRGLAWKVANPFSGLMR